jgi:hypothetical protein
MQSHFNELLNVYEEKIKGNMNEGEIIKLVDHINKYAIKLNKKIYYIEETDYKMYYPGILDLQKNGINLIVKYDKVYRVLYMKGVELMQHKLSLIRSKYIDLIEYVNLSKLSDTEKEELNRKAYVLLNLEKV